MPDLEAKGGSATPSPAGPAPIVPGEVAAVETKETPQTVSPFVDNDGKFSSDWKNHIPEEYRGEKCLDLFTDVPGMVKSFVHAHKAVGKNKVVIPDEKSPQMDWDAYYKAIGRPEKPTEFAFERGKDVPENLWDGEFVDGLKTKLWEAGATPKVVKAVEETYNSFLSQIPVAKEQAELQKREAADAELKKEWGAAYQDNVHAANLFIEKTTKPGPERDRILEMGGNDPMFIRWVAGWGKKVKEANVIDTSSFQKTPGDLIARDRELLATPGFVDATLRKTDPYRYEQILKERKEIAEQLTKSNTAR